LLPPPLNQLVGPAAKSLRKLEHAVRDAGGQLILSDAFRTFDMQMQAFLDWQSGKKKAYSPPPGHSFHEAGRAIDISLDDLGIKLLDFWVLAKKQGWVPIVSKPRKNISEAWHFEYRGYFAELIPIIRIKKTAKLAIMDIGIKENITQIVQMHLKLQDFYAGNIDGVIGPITEKAVMDFKAKYGLPIDTSFDSYFILLLRNKTYDKFGN